MITRKYNSGILLLGLLLILISCKNHYNEMIEWTSNIKQGTSVETVKTTQPEFVEIDWEDPEIIGNEKKYYVTKIKGNYDPLGMSNCLVFDDDGFQGREAHK